MRLFDSLNPGPMDWSSLTILVFAAPIMVLCMVSIYRGLKK